MGRLWRLARARAAPPPRLARHEAVGPRHEQRDERAEDRAERRPGRAAAELALKVCDPNVLDPRPAILGRSVRAVPFLLRPRVERAPHLAEVRFRVVGVAQSNAWRREPQARERGVVRHAHDLARRRDGGLLLVAAQQNGQAEQNRAQHGELPAQPRRRHSHPLQRQLHREKSSPDEEQAMTRVGAGVVALTLSLLRCSASAQCMS